ncbi:hypothetical protein E1281_36135 [Actinomadura sp. KC345]|uniref:hypothetical protein n=1 Tax=Actinomadura sp. KC345 TaxID=2530371 RepID=UPI001049B363|nr:hypothetical protein [Actinomadura sp. KC345]TDC42488.1 hypothetical protein E1281_36135 [Actinomadura sp. KC345]
MTEPRGCVNLAVLLREGKTVGHVHRSVLDRVSEIASRLGCREAAALGRLPVSFTGTGVPRLHRDLEQVIAFAAAARRTGWVLGEIAVAPAERPVLVMRTDKGRLWAHSARGFEMHDSAGVRQISELDSVPGVARRAPLTDLILPLAEAVAHARVLELRPR